jgi:type IX secretion system PorP/SprF family membrane protein
MKKILSIIIIMAACKIGFAQDAQFSQMIWNNIYLNPAQAGTDSLDNRLFGIYRDQWRQVGMPYVAADFSYDRAIHLKNTSKHSLGVGGHFFYNRAGSANLSNIIAELILSYSLKFNEQKQRISLGISSGYGNRSLNPSKLIFTDIGDGMGGENIENDQMHIFRLTTGIHFSSLLKDKGNFDIGFVVFNPHQPTGTFFNAETKQNARYSAYTKFNFKAGDKWQIQPSFIHNSQAQNHQELMNVLMRYQMNKVGLWFGPGYRWADAFIGYVGAEFSNFRVGFSYDQNISDFKKATNGIGAFEASLAYAWTKKKPIKPEVFEPVEEIAEEKVVEVVPEVVEPEPIVEVVVVEPTPEEVFKEKIKKTFEAGSVVKLYFDNNEPSGANLSKNYHDLANLYISKVDEYKAKAGSDAEKFFNDEVIAEYNLFEGVAEYMLEALKEGHNVNISIKGYASSLGSKEYNQKLTERRVKSIEKYLLEFNNGAISSYVTNGQLVIAREPLGSNKKNEAVGKNPVYSPEFAKDRRVEIKIEKIK